MQLERTAVEPTARSLSLHRSNAQRAILLATGAAILVLSFAVSVLVALGVREPGNAVRATLATAGVADSSVVLTATPALHVSAQDAAVRRIIAATFRDAPIHVSSQRTPATTHAAATIRWTITPNSRTMALSDLAALQYGFEHIDAKVNASAAAQSTDAQLSGRGAQTVSTMRAAIAAVDAVLPIPLSVLAISGIIALLLCARLLTTTRENESRLLRARGSFVRTMVLADAVEAFVPALVGAAVGAAIAQLVLLIGVGAPTGWAEVVLPPLVIVAAAVALSSLNGIVAARVATGSPHPASGRAVAAASASLGALLIAVSAIALWRFLQYGTPVAGRPEDAAAVLAPALLLCTAAVIGLLVFFPVSGFLERRASRRPGLNQVLAARSLHRNLRLFAGPIALVVLSIATATMASGYASTWNEFLRQSTRLVTGSDVRATFGGVALATDASSVLDWAAYSKLSAVVAVAPVLRESDQLGDQNITTIGVSAAQLHVLVGPSSSVIDSAALQRALTPSASPLPGIELPAGTRSATVTIETTRTGAADSAGSVVPTLWLADARGSLVPIVLGGQSTGRSGSTRVIHTLTVPPSGPWRIVAMDADVVATHAIHGFSFGLSSVSAETSTGRASIPLADPKSWTPQSAVFSNGTSGAGSARTIGFSRSTIPANADTAVRLMPPGSARAPIVVSRALANADRLRIGDDVDVTGQWASFSARVSGIVPLVPGVSNQASIMGDLASIDSGWLRSSVQVPALHELWIAGSPLSSVGREVADVRSAHVITASGAVSRRFVGSAVLGLWLGAGVSAAFAIVTLAASIASLGRRRRREEGTLRALGVGAPAQARMRRAELVVVLSYATAVGLAAGAGVFGVTVGTLARASTPEAPAVLPLLLQLDPIPLAVLVAALLLASSIVIASYSRAVRASANGAKP
jgi:hypothetical protein